MMQHVVPVIVERVNRFFGYAAVDRVSIRQGIVRIEKTKSRIAPPSLRPVPAGLGDSLLEVADPELRACLEALARGLGAPEEPAIAAIPIVGTIGGVERR
jgi:hypothetical protein